MQYTDYGYRLPDEDDFYNVEDMNYNTRMIQGELETLVKNDEFQEFVFMTDEHMSDTSSNPHNVTKAQVGLGNVDNTSDASKPISTATANALALKANTSSLSKVATSGAYSDLSGRPTAVSAFTNDKGYLTAHQDISGKLDKSNVVSKGSSTNPVYFDSSGVAQKCTYTLSKSVPSDAVFTDTKNTAGSTNTSSKIFLIGATSQSANPQTYSRNLVYAGIDGHLYSCDVQVVNLSATQALTNKTYNGYTLGAACARGCTSSATSGSSSLITSGGIYSKAQPVIKYTDVSWTTQVGPNPDDASGKAATSLTGTGYNQHVFLAQIIKAWPKSTWDNAQVSIIKMELNNTYPTVYLRSGNLQQYDITVRFYYTESKWNNSADK